MAQKIRDAADAHPQRVIAVRVSDFRLQFGRLPSDQRMAVTELAGGADRAPRWYQRKMAAMLEDVLKKSRQGHPYMLLGVHGIPFEGDSTDEANAAFKDVIDDVQAFVVPRTFLLSNNPNPEATVRNALPKSFKFADGRPVYFRTNQDWSMAVSLPGREQLKLPRLALSQHRLRPSRH
jgi:hypothetical protein